ncbi:hypothetical protein PAECIP111893_01402 [Paenibacillus plantiphilus]|uniref:Fibronectin type-III domain-containing protein n=1 Tax=Paenibacillus plantiphilus TaxID=2905650 RepID=A0ABN8G602_9BACL|nr:carbohydrate binding domain-containing protein [Paenibacillus plantiphilus]CAH1200505.1 hypothetical protein PAECIP111893_01402 [Paenibacillus plantiphilus]
MVKKWISGALSLIICLSMLLTITPVLISAEAGGTATVYYYTPYKNWGTVNMHHSGSGEWTTLPGTAMETACTNWTSKTISLGSNANFQMVFNNGSGSWDNNGGNNYTASSGIHQVKNGQLLAGAGNPCGEQPDGNKTTVYYKANTSWTNVNIHYSPSGGTWTTPPGVAMEQACVGWKKKTVDIGTATGLVAAFNNGSSWDNNGNKNYTLGTGDVKIENGVISAGSPCGDSTPPSVPTGLTLGTVTSTSAAITWTASTDNVGVTGYDIYRNGTLVKADATATSYTDTGLTESTTYNYTVLAKDAAGNKSAQSTALPATTTAGVDTIAPSVPAGVTKGAVTTTSVAITWTASTDNVGVTGYDIYKGTELAGSVAGTVTSYNATGLTPNTAYSFTVKAKDAAGNVSDASEALSATTLNIVESSNLLINPGFETYTGTTGIANNWTKSVTSGVTSTFEVVTTSVSEGSKAQQIAGSSLANGNVAMLYQYVPFAANASYTASGQFKVNSLTNARVQLYLDFYNGSTIISSKKLDHTQTTSGFIPLQLSGTTPAGTTRVKVYAILRGSAAGGAGSFIVDDMKFLSGDGPGDDTQAPSIPANLASNGKTETTVSLSWTASTDNVGVTGYDIFRNGTKVGTSATTSYTDTGLTAATSYKYTVKAYDAAGNRSAVSNEATVVTSEGTDTQAPTAPAALASTGKTATTVSLSWTASTDNVGVTGYDIFRNGTKVGTSATTSYTDTGLTAATSYKYTVKAYDAAGNRSAVSNEATVVTSTGPDTLAPSVPADLASTGKTATTVSLSWTASTDNVGVTGYEVYRGTALVGTTAATTYTDTGLTAATAYSYSVLAKDAADNKSAKSPALEVTTSTGGTGNIAEVYYYSKTRNWSQVNIHYRPTGGAWTPVPGVAMSETACTDWTKKTINLGTATGMNAVFNNGSSWDNNGGADYNLGFGIITVKDGVITANAPSPCAPLPVDETAPSVPQNLQAVATNINIAISWTASTDNAGGRGLAGYEVTRTGGTQGTKVFTTANNFYNDSKLDAQTTYTYTVKAYDKAVPVNTSASSLPASAKTGDAPQQPVGGTPLGTDIREDSIYFVMTARFFDGDSSNNQGGSEHVKSGNAANNDPMFRGDFKGLIDKLDYIKALGFSAIWITPVVLNRSDYDFHGYHGYDFFRIDPRLESPGATYQDLINAAHNKDIKIVQDVVYNHSSRWGAKGLFTPKVFGIRDSQWSSYYDEPQAGLEYDGVTADANGKPYNGDLWSTEEPADNTCRNWGVQQSTNPQGKKVYNCQWPGATTGMFPSEFYHPCWIGNWEGEDGRSCWIHEDLADFNTESAVVQEYLKEAHRRFIDMGVDSFRIDTAVHVPRVMWNRHFLPDAQNYAIEKFGEKGKNFFMFGEVGAFVHDKWNRGSVNHSAQFFTWKERKEYSSNDTTASLEQYNYENGMGISNQPTSTNAFLNGNNYHTPDHSKYSGMSVIDMRMHMNFGEANNAFHNGKDSDDSYNDATYNVVYVDSHDYGPNKAKNRFAGGTDAWAENMNLMWTFRGIPTLYYGSEIEFKAGAPTDCGASCPLETTGRAYFGNHIEGSVVASEFGKADSATGAVAATLNHPLVKHVQRLNQIRRKVPALQKGQYSTDKINGNMSFKRRYTDAAKGVDSFVLVTISGSATFNDIPNGTYKDAITGDTKVVNNNSLTASVSGKGNMRVYVLDLPGNPAPGKIGVDGTFLK